MATVAEFLPRGPVYRPRSGTVDNPDAYLTTIREFKDACLEEAVANLRMNPEYEEMEKYISMLDGRQWDPARPRFRSHFCDNRMASARLDKLALMTDIQPTIEVVTEVDAFLRQAKACENIIQYEWEKMNLNRALVAACDHAMFSVGFWKIGSKWPGYTAVSAHGMDTVLPIQPGLDIQESTGIVYRCYRPVQYFERIFGERAKGIDSEAISPATSMRDNSRRPFHISEYTWDALSPRVRRRISAQGGSQTAMLEKNRFPVVEEVELWIDDLSINETPYTVRVKDPRFVEDAHNYWYDVPPGERLFPRKRLMVFAGNKLMYDGPSPYWHGLYPFAQLILRPTVWHPGGQSMYRPLAPIQRAINRVGAGVLENVEASNNPTVIVRDGAVKPGDWERFIQGAPGGKLKMTPMGIPNQDIQYKTPPQLAPELIPFSSYLYQAFDRLAGTVDVATLGRKNQVPGGDTIEQMRDTMQTTFRLEARQLGAFLRDAGRIAVSNIFQHYSLRRRLSILGPDGQTREDYDYDPGIMAPFNQPPWEHVHNFTLRIAEGSMHGNAKDRQKQTYLAMFRLGLLSRKAVLRVFGIGESAKIEAEIAEERNLGVEPDATGKGRIPRLTRSARVAGV